MTKKATKKTECSELSIEYLQEAARMLRLLAHPHRLKIIDILEGEKDGLAVGDVLTINQRGRKIRDLVKWVDNVRDHVTLPDEPAGTLLVFRTFSRVSFGLVMRASRGIHVGDRVLSPDQ